MDDSFWQAFQTWEKQTSGAWTDLIRSPEFVDLMHRQLESWLFFTQQMDQATEVACQKAGLSTRREQDQILFLIHKLENQVEESTEAVQRIRQMIQSSGG
jgi:hypothetical protein